MSKNLTTRGLTTHLIVVFVFQTFDIWIFICFRKILHENRIGGGGDAGMKYYNLFLDKANAFHVWC